MLHIVLFSFKILGPMKTSVNVMSDEKRQIIVCLELIQGIEKHEKTSSDQFFDEFVVLEDSENGDAGHGDIYDQHLKNRKINSYSVTLIYSSHSPS